MRSIQIAGASLASALLLAACSGVGVTPSSPSAVVPSSLVARSTGGVNPDACATSKIYVADYLESDVEIYSQGVSNPSPCGKIKSGINSPEAVYVNAKGRVYVANYIGGTVTEYVKGSLKFTLTLEAPAYDIVVGTSGKLYAAEPAISGIVEYPSGATSPSLTITVNGEPYGVALDKSANLYVSYLSNADGVTHVEKFAPKATTGTDLGITEPFGGELKLDTANSIVIGDRNDDLINIYAKPYGPLTRSFSTPAGRPVFLALDNAEANLYVSGLNEVQVFDYATGVLDSSIATGLRDPSGVALYPPAPY
jgi:hypothetical protein